jgi:hydrogenase-4 component H
MKKPKLRELREAIKAIFTGPYTIKSFPAKPIEPYEGFRGKPEYHEEDCIGCGACAEVCPPRAIEFIDDLSVTPPVRRFILHTDNCIFCGQCEFHCTTKTGITLSTKYDLATFDRSECVETVEKELALCEICGEVITAKDHLKWIGRKLGAKRYANPTLLMAYEDELGGLPQEAERQEKGVERSDINRILCPQCRRKVGMREIWG